ncbi:UbiA family prenyltransferase [Haloarcula marismortui]|uniref:UbiA family prenyltransferase n=1 Tax=Haloarcula marismortui TaxID=2238 RepID=UPI0012695E1C|nr:UbiA family prenyltransferase [Haloarcula californiae]
MSSRPEPTENSGRNFLAENESPQLEWSGTVKKEENSYSADFIATNSRLILSRGEGHFKDLGLDSIESVETGVGTRTEREGISPNATLTFSIISILAGLGWLLFAGSGVASAIFGSIFIALGLHGLRHGISNYDELKENMDISEYRIYNVVLRTSPQSQFSKPLHIETRQNIGPDLSRIIQEES